jgi:lysophospholipase L1-like esterase
MHIAVSQRARALLIVVLVAVGLIAANAPANASPPRERPTSETEAPEGTYLALGDSVPFGYRGGVPQLYPKPSNFVGYPELVAEDLDLRLLNASCPGETTASFSDVTAQSNGCSNAVGSGIAYRDNFRLHVNYHGSQLDYALRVLEKAPHVRLVTLQLGANDGFLCQAAGGCTSPEQIAVVAEQVRANLKTILDTLRSEGDYRGRIVVVTYYALNYADPTVVAGTQILDQAITAVATQVKGVVVADGFAAFQGPSLAAGGSPTAAGLVYPNDVHPTPQGQRLLATAVEQAVGH